MFKKIKYLLYNIGFLKLELNIDKINYLLCCPNIDTFRIEYYTTYIKTLEKNILNHLIIMEEFSLLNISGEKVNYLIESHNILLSDWFSNKGFMLNSKDKFMSKWLYLCKKIIYKTEALVNNIKTGNEYHNFSLLKNIYADINNIINILFNIFKK